MPPKQSAKKRTIFEGTRIVAARLSGHSVYGFRVRRDPEPNDPDSPINDIDRIRLNFSPSLHLYDLTRMTEQELDMFQRAINVLCDTARPLCRQIDEFAATRPELSYSFQRTFRPDPMYKLFDEKDQPLP